LDICAGKPDRNTEEKHHVLSILAVLTFGEDDDGDTREQKERSGF